MIIKIFPKKIFYLISTTSSIKIYLPVIRALHVTQTWASSCSKQRIVSNKSDQYVIYLKQCLLSLCYREITVCLEVLVQFQETYWILKQFHPILFAKFGNICLAVTSKYNDYLANNVCCSLLRPDLAKNSIIQN